MCYCYDDIENCQYDEEIFFLDERGRQFGKTQNGTVKPLPTPQELLLQQINKEFKIYVAAVVPKQMVGGVVAFEVCKHEESTGEDFATDVVTLSENLSQDNSEEGFTINESLFLPSWQLWEPAEAVSTWTRIELSDGSDLVPLQAPPFFVYRFTSDLEKVAHLPVGVQKEQYGDLLDDFSVRSYCGKYDIEDLIQMDLGHPNICSS